MTLKGVSSPKNTFYIKEGFKKPDFNIIKMMLDPDNDGVPVYIVREYYDKETCLNLKDEFFNIINETSGGNRQKDFVPVQQIGSTQFMKETKDYFNECDETRAHIHRLINSLKNTELIDDFMLESFLSKSYREIGMDFRPSHYDSRKVNAFTARKWTNDHQELALLPHEDLSQLKNAKLDNYEIGWVKKVIACNLCVSNENGGELLIWNIIPSEETKLQLGVENNGYPFPTESLVDYESLSVEINQGDLYFINATCIHAVKEIKSKDRISLGRFMGINKDNEVVYWT